MRRSSGWGYENPLRYPMDRGAWWATVHRVAKNQTWLKQLTTHAHSLNFTLLLFDWKHGYSNQCSCGNLGILHIMCTVANRSPERISLLHFWILVSSTLCVCVCVCLLPYLSASYFIHGKCWWKRKISAAWCHSLFTFWHFLSWTCLVHFFTFSQPHLLCNHWFTRYNLTSHLNPHWMPLDNKCPVLKTLWHWRLGCSVHTSESVEEVMTGGLFLTNGARNW